MLSKPDTCYVLINNNVLTVRHLIQRRGYQRNYGNQEYICSSSCSIQKISLPLSYLLGERSVLDRDNNGGLRGCETEKKTRFLFSKPTI